jgi:hypothetical protein
MGTAQLNYSISGRRLWGAGGKRSVSVVAVSGGRAGSTTPGAVDPMLANNLLYMNQKAHLPKVHGGPLPIGRYIVAAPASNDFGGGKKVYSAKLSAIAGSSTLGMFGRGGFYIHGRGPHGSEGCIVPNSGKEFQQVMSLLKATSGGQLTVWP